MSKTEETHLHGRAGQKVGAHSPGETVRSARCICGLCGGEWWALVSERYKRRYRLECIACGQHAGVERDL